MTNKNEAGVDHDFDAAVIELRKGNKSNALKFGAILILTFFFVGGLLTFVLTVGDAVKEMFNPDLGGDYSDLEE